MLVRMMVGRSARDPQHLSGQHPVHMSTWMFCAVIGQPLQPHILCVARIEACMHLLTLQADGRCKSQ
jgi:hypothetical protein